jgi:hypothetical protein
MDKFLEAYIQPKLNQEDINHLNSPFIHNEIEAVLKSLPTMKSLEPDGFIAFIAKFFQSLKEEVTTILLKLSRK